MCGIAGIISLIPIEKKSIEQMTEALLHRGPDARGVYLSSTNTIALGHTRLSVIDLSLSAAQPFYSSNNRYVVVFNGEIYNFKIIKEELRKHHNVSFKSHSDTEVIAEGFSVWGIKMVDKLEGMFAIVIADQLENKLYLFRDRVGKKPLYYFQCESFFAFASEIKSLLRYSLIREKVSFNKNIVSTFLHLGYIPQPHTIYSNIYKFPAGYFGEVTHTLNFKKSAYWRIEDKLDVTGINSEEEAKSKLNELLENAVQKRLISDVPLGSFLSGGTDSSLITAIASKHKSQLKTFNIGFKESKFNESAYAKRVANYLNTDHQEYVLSQKEAVEMIDTYLNHFDEPFADTSAIPTMLVSKLARKEVTVALTGDGGDELFLGYGAYDWANRLENPFVNFLQRPLASALSTYGNDRLKRVSHLLERVDKKNIRSHIFSQEQYFFSQQELIQNLIGDKNQYSSFEYTDINNEDFFPAEKQALFDFKYYLKDDLLVKVDRASMFYALECRSPLLDHNIVEFAYNLPYHFKKRDAHDKWILKELLKKYLPLELINRPKWGFSIPLGDWLKNDLKYLIDDYLNDNIVEEIGLFNKYFIRELIQSFYKGDKYLYNRIWIIIVLHKWIKENG